MMTLAVVILRARCSARMLVRVLLEDGGLLRLEGVVHRVGRRGRWLTRPDLELQRRLILLHPTSHVV